MLAMTLTLNFQGQIFDNWSYYYEMEKRTYQLSYRSQISPLILPLAMTLTLNFQG